MAVPVKAGSAVLVAVVAGDDAAGGEVAAPVDLVLAATERQAQAKLSLGLPEPGSSGDPA